MSDIPNPDDLTPDDLELVRNPIADHVNHPVPVWQARLLLPLVPAYTLVRRAAAATVTGHFDAIDIALREAEETGQVEACLRVAIMELATVAIDGAEGDKQLAASYFEALLMRQQIDNEIRGDD